MGKSIFYSFPNFLTPTEVCILFTALIITGENDGEFNKRVKSKCLYIECEGKISTVILVG